MTEKRDESRDVAVWDSIECESHIMRACQWEPGMDARAHHVPFSSLESVTRERDAAVRRVTELEAAARKVIDNIPGCLCQTVEFDMFAHDLESLITPKDPSDAERR